MKSTSDLIQLAGLGVSLTINASAKSTSDLIQIAGILNTRGGKLRLLNAGTKPTSDLIKISGVLRENIELVFE